jgi:serine/threonine protein kinase
MEQSTIQTAADLARLAQRTGLLSEEQANDCLAELGNRLAPAETLARMFERKTLLTAFQTAKLLKGDSDGYVLGGYRLLYRIAAGSFGRVFRGDDPRSGQVVAIKVLRRRWTDDPRKIALFEREGKVGMTLHHPNIVEMLAVSRDPTTGMYYMVMEFIEGGNLRDFLAIRKKIAPEEGLKIIEDAASGLAYAFSRGMTHRDIKLTNILVSTSGLSKLVDFGLAEIKGAFGEDDESGVDRTVDYAGLERLTGVKQGDIRSDIYFLGTVLYEILTGEPLLELTKDKRQRMARQRFMTDAKLEKGLTELPFPMRPLLNKMLTLDPNERYQNPGLLVEAIRATRTALEGNQSGPKSPTGPRTVYVVEQKMKYQDQFRGHLKDMGFRVLMSVDASRALQRFQQQPFHALVVDAANSGDECVEVFERIQKEARHLGLRCGGILILAESQAHLAHRVTPSEDVAVMQMPVSGRQILQRIAALVPVGEWEIADG